MNKTEKELNIRVNEMFNSLYSQFPENFLLDTFKKQLCIESLEEFKDWQKKVQGAVKNLNYKLRTRRKQARNRRFYTNFEKVINYIKILSK
jgi:hypothetical protein